MNGKRNIHGWMVKMMVMDSQPANQTGFNSTVTSQYQGTQQQYLSLTLIHQESSSSPAGMYKHSNSCLHKWALIEWSDKKTRTQQICNTTPHLSTNVARRYISSDSRCFPKSTQNLSVLLFVLALTDAYTPFSGLAVFTFFFYSILRWSVAVSTMHCQSSRIAVFLQEDARPMFCWPRSASTVRSQVWLGLPGGRFQSGGSHWITAATVRWWSSCGELGQYVQRAANVCQWPGGREDGIRWLLWLPHSSHDEYMVSSGSCVKPTCQMHQCESTGALWWTTFHTHTTRQGLCMSGRP